MNHRGRTAPENGKLGEDRPRLAVIEGLSLSMPLDPFLPLTALSTYSGLSRRRLSDLLKDPFHPLPHYRIGGKILVRRGEYDAWALHYRRVGDPDVERIVAETLQGLR